MEYHEIKIMNTSKDPQPIVVKKNGEVIEILLGRQGFNAEIKQGDVFTVDVY